MYCSVPTIMPISLSMATRPVVSGINQFGDTEIEDFRNAAAGPREHHVFGFEIAMYEFVTMRLLDGRTDAAKQPAHTRRFDAAHLLHLPTQRDAINELHDQEHPAVGNAEIVDRHHVGVRKPCRQLAFTAESFDRIGSLERVVPNELRGHLPAKGEIDGRVYRAHAALSEATFETIAIDKRAGHRNGSQRVAVACARP